MFTRIRLQNFQAHKDSTLDLHPGVNVITGPSDQGKSSVLRALGWVLFNNLRGDGYRREGAPKGEPVWVKVTTPEGDITRSRKGNTNTYDVNGTPFAAVGTNVPEQVEDMLHVSPYCMQKQGEGPFMLDSPPGEVAKAINALAGFEIDGVFTALNSRQVRARTLATAQLEIVQDVDASIAASPDVDKAEKMLAVCERLQERITAQATTIFNLSGAVRRVMQSRDKLTSARRTMDSLGDVRTAVAVREDLLAVISTRSTLALSVSNISKATARRDKASDELRNIRQSIEAARKSIKYCPTCKRPLEVV
jgi:DNA repair exonuclease SbcCD ATPase subunit